MGLDITSYEHVSLVEGEHEFDPDACYDLGHIQVYVPAESFIARLGGLRDRGCYVPSGHKLSFRAGSYSGYNAFREDLCNAALGVHPGAVWRDPHEFEGRPFVEMINFSDCEGCIGPTVCAKLAHDFLSHRYLRDSDSEWGEYWGELYDQWQAAYELASVDGMVAFH